jgi:hypothetical protein
VRRSFSRPSDPDTRDDDRRGRTAKLATRAAQATIQIYSVAQARPQRRVLAAEGAKHEDHLSTIARAERPFKRMVFCC